MREAPKPGFAFFVATIELKHVALLVPVRLLDRVRSANAFGRRSCNIFYITTYKGIRSMLCAGSGWSVYSANKKLISRPKATT